MVPGSVDFMQGIATGRSFLRNSRQLSVRVLCPFQLSVNPLTRFIRGNMSVFAWVFPQDSEIPPTGGLNSLPKSEKLAL